MPLNYIYRSNIALNNGTDLTDLIKDFAKNIKRYANNFQKT